ncbi:hypothetical protein [Streptomyces sp. NPDC059076]|uniref:hypothetical protein n=1 Tax=unclassified Streptomyces TaxID=2593676 RepID=UPI0036BDEF77
MSTLHIVPVDDLIAHDTSTTEAHCACGPETRPDPQDDGSMGWLLVHASLDGREHTGGQS